MLSSSLTKAIPTPLASSFTSIIVPMVKSNRSSSISSENSANEENRNNTSYKRLKMVNSNMAYPSNSISLMSNNTKTQAAFINKLYKMLEDPDTVELISWSTNGDLFSVSNPTAFSKTVLPQYFKHNNWQSFVRQLNMYGFHKVNDLIHSNLTNENQTWEFKHPHFRKGAIDDLQFIKRKSTKTQHQLLLLHQQQQQQQQHLQQQQQQQQQQLIPPSDPSTSSPTPQSLYQLPLPPTLPFMSSSPTASTIPSSLTSDNNNNNSNNGNETGFYSNTTDNQSMEINEQQQETRNNIITKSMLQLENQVGTISKACDVIFNELVNLRMIVAKQQYTMQDLVEVVSASKNNTVCTCENPRNNNSDNNNRELQNAENLRLQVSKLKENMNRSSPSDSYTSSIGNWSNEVNSSPNTTPTSFQANQNYFSQQQQQQQQQQQSQQDQKRLPSIDYLQQQNNKLDDLKSSMSDYSSNGSSGENTTTESGDSIDIYQRKSSSSSSSSSLERDSSNLSDSNQNRSMMGLGKRSHLLNPILADSKKKKQQ